jgi:uncharacterized protein YbjT (DUF2867 family)
MILVLGASGFAGLAVTRALAGLGVEVRGLVRRVDATDVVRAAGASDVIVADLRDLDAIETAARGSEGIFFLGPRFMPEEAALGKAVIDIAIRVGVRRFVLSGVYHPTIQALVNHRSKLEIEDHLYKTDLEYTVLQPARFMHGLLLSSWRRMAEEGVLADAFDSQAKMAYVDYRDVAHVAAIAFHDDRLVRGTFELAAPGEHSLHEIAAMVSEVFGRPIRAEQAPLHDYAPARSLLSNPYSADGFQRLRRYYGEYGFRGGNSLVLSAILGRPPSDFVSCATGLREAAAAHSLG